MIRRLPGDERGVIGLKGIVIIIAVFAVILIYVVDLPTMLKLEQVKKNLKIKNTILVDAIEQYRINNGKYPENLGAIRQEYLGALPPDPFNPAGGPYQYRLWNDNGVQTYVLWSYGPDRDNDNANPRYNPANGKRSNGDIVRIGSREGL
jgi:hypothetical protein